MNSEMGKRRRASLTIGMKKELCQYKIDHPTVKLRELIKIFSEKWDTAVGRTTISDILRERDKWLSISEHFEDIRRVSGGRHQALEDTLYDMFVDARNHNEIITDEWLLKSARQIGRDMNITDFQYSTGWLSGFKRRFVIMRSKINGQNSLICKSESAIHRPRNPVMKRPKRGCQLGLSEQKDVLERCPLSYMYDSSTVDPMLTVTGTADITVEEAREALIKVITFMSGITVREDYLCMLLNLLKYLETYSSSLHTQDMNDALLKYEEALMSSGNVADGHSQDNGNGVEGASDSVDIIGIKEERISDDGNDQNKCDNSDGQTQCDVLDNDDAIVDGAKDMYVNTGCVVPKRRSDLVIAKALMKQVNKTKEDKYGKYVKFVDVSMRYECVLCGKTFAYFRRCRRHVKLVHSGERPFKCSVCQKAFPENATLKKHERIHTGEKRFLCTICGKNLSSSGGLVIHVRCHTGEKPFTCPQCDKSFSHPSGLSEHRRVHSNEKPYACSACGKAFKRSTELSVHKRVHTGEQPYKCIVCLKTFTKWSYWKNHMRGHTGEKPYDCQFCGKAFSQKALLNNHLRVHTGERPFSCPVCGRRFSQSGSLYHHQKMHK